MKTNLLSSDVGDGGDTRLLKKMDNGGQLTVGLENVFKFSRPQKKLHASCGKIAHIYTPKTSALPNKTYPSKKPLHHPEDEDGPRNAGFFAFQAHGW